MPEHFWPDPLARPEPGPHQSRPRTLLYGVGRDLEAHDFFLARAQPEMLFLVTLQYKMRRRPAQARDRPEYGPKTEARHVP
jgi:hypothetical protein